MREHNKETKLGNLGLVWKSFYEEDRINLFPITSKQLCINIYSQMDLWSKAFTQTKNDKVSAFSWNVFDLKGQAFGIYKDFIETDRNLFLKLTPLDKYTEWIWKVNLSILPEICPRRCIQSVFWHVHTVAGV